MKPKAPRWLTESFRDGVDERETMRALYDLAFKGTGCCLAQHDPHDRPCSGRLERFHYINRQRVENALGALLPRTPYWHWPGERGITGELRDELILLAAWDPRVGGIGCEGHHRRLDSHLTPELVIAKSALPDHLLEFATDWGLESSLEERFPVEIGA